MAIQYTDNIIVHIYIHTVKPA